MHVGEAEVATMKMVGQLLVVKAQQVEDHGLEIVHVDFVAGNGESQLVRLPVGKASLDPYIKLTESPAAASRWRPRGYRKFHPTKNAP